MHLDNASQQARIEAARAILHRLAALGADVPTVILGDFNHDPIGDVYEILQAGGFRDAWLEAGRADDDGAFTIHRFTGRRVAGEGRIDWVLVSKHFDVERARILKDCRAPRYPSDHYPLPGRAPVALASQCTVLSSSPPSFNVSMREAVTAWIVPVAGPEVLVIDGLAELGVPCLRAGGRRREELHVPGGAPRAPEVAMAADHPARVGPRLEQLEERRGVLELAAAGGAVARRAVVQADQHRPVRILVERRGEEIELRAIQVPVGPAGDLRVEQDDAPRADVDHGAGLDGAAEERAPELGRCVVVAGEHVGGQAGAGEELVEPPVRAGRAVLGEVAGGDDQVRRLGERPRGAEHRAQRFERSRCHRWSRPRSARYGDR